MKNKAAAVGNKSGEWGYWFNLNFNDIMLI